MNFFNKYKSMFWYGLMFFGLIVVVIFEAQFFLGKIEALSSTEADLSQKVKLLNDRNNTLTSLSPEVIEASKQIATVLPSENSVLLVSAQIRNAAIESKVNMKNLSTATIPDETNPGSGATQVGVIVEGDTPSVLQFLANITTLAPIIEMSGVNLITNPTSTIAQLTLLSFWSPFPTQLPSITEPVISLTDDETTLLKRVSSYSIPVVSGDFQESTNSAIIVNSAPFAPIR